MKNDILYEDRALVKFLSKANVNQLEVFTVVDFKSNSKNLMTKIFELHRKFEFNNFSELKSSVYDKQQINDSRFVKLYDRFREKLINTLFFVNTNNAMFSERAKAYYHCSKRAILIRILVDRGNNISAIKLAKTTLPVSMKYEFTDITVMIAKSLIRHYSSNGLDSKNLEKFRLIYKKYYKIYLKELSVEELMSEVIFRRNSEKVVNDGSSKFYINKEKIIQDLLIYSKEDLTIELIVSCSTIILDYFEYKHDFFKFKEYANIFFDKINSKPFLSVLTLEHIITAQLRITVITKDLKVAHELKAKHFSKLTLGNFNWFVTYIYYILTLIHCKRYLESYHELDIVLNYHTFNKQPPIITEVYYILEAYIYFLFKIGKINANPKKDFRVSKFLNQVPEYSKDKAGINIPIILIQSLFFLAERKYNKLIDRMESLSLYSYRYFKKDETIRSQCFIRMFYEVIRAGFKKQGSEFRTQKWRSKLATTPIDTYPEYADIEIIPYEDLWEMVLELLD